MFEAVSIFDNESLYIYVVVFFIQRESQSKGLVVLVVLWSCRSSCFSDDDYFTAMESDITVVKREDR